MQAAAQIHFFSCELLASNVGHPFAGVAGVVCGPALLCCLWLGPLLTNCLLLCNNVQKRKEREDRNSQVKESLLQI